MTRFYCVICLVLLFKGPSSTAAEQKLVLRDCDRVVLIGGTLIEREQRYGYWETALISAYPQHNLIVRNLGWSGDTVYGDSRAGFDTAKEGFRRLVDHVKALKPTVIIIAYGSNEAFDEKETLRFFEGLKRLLDALEPTNARCALIDPPPHEDIGRPFPAAANYNLTLRLQMIDTIIKFKEYAPPLISLVPRDRSKQGKATTKFLTENGIHFSPFGYWHTAMAFRKALAPVAKRWQLAVDARKNIVQAEGTTVTGLETDRLRFRLTDDELPLCNPPSDIASPSDANQRRLRVAGLSLGNHTLQIDGQKVATASADEWTAGVLIRRGPEFDQVEKLRAAIIAKNQLYFYRWRPQNETYLFGFRKHEQGQNAKEVVLFDPLVDQEEKKIAELRRPVTHQYDITPATEGK